MMLVAPNCSNRRWASRLDPSPTASIEITAATPKTMPRTGRPERSLWSTKLFMPSFKLRKIRRMDEALRDGREAGGGVEGSSGRTVAGEGNRRSVGGGGLGLGLREHPGAGAVLDDLAVAHPDDP